MALIKCPECGKEISNLAISCPSCGIPLQLDLINNQNNKITYVQSTDQIKRKKWKRVILYCLGALIISTFLSGGSPLIPLTVAIIVMPIALIAGIIVSYYE